MFRERTKVLKSAATEAKGPIPSNEKTPLVIEASQSILKNGIEPCPYNIGAVRLLLAAGALFGFHRFLVHYRRSVGWSIADERSLGSFREPLQLRRVCPLRYAIAITRFGNSPGI